jgi:hypothetical protein
MKKWVVISLLFSSISLIQAQEIGARFGDISDENVAATGGPFFVSSIIPISAGGISDSM